MKKIIVLSLFLVLALAVSGVQAQTTVRWAQHAGMEGGLDYFIDLYEQETGINIDLEILPPDLMWQKMMVEAQARSYTYDIGYHSPGWFGYYHEHVADLRPYIEQYGFDMDQYDEVVIEAFMMSRIMRGDDVIAIPHNPQTPVVIYRKDWFEHPDEQAAFQEQYGRELQAPETWDELYDIAVFFTRSSGEMLAGQELETSVYGYAAPLTPPGEMARSFSVVFYSLGLQGWDENFQPDIDHPILLDGIAFWKKLVEDTTPPAAVSWVFNDQISYFTEGRLAMGEMWPAGVTTVEAPGAGSAGNTGYTPLPRWEGNLLDLPIGRTWLGGGGTLIFDTPRTEEAFKFLQWLYEENEIEFVIRTSSFSRKNHFTDPRVLEAEPYYDDFLPAIQRANSYAHIRPAVPEWGDVLYRSMGEFANDIIYGLITPEEAQERWYNYMVNEFEIAGYYDEE